MEFSLMRYLNAWIWRRSATRELISSAASTNTPENRLL